MQSITTTKTIHPDQKLIKAKEKFIAKLNDALRKEQDLSTVFIGKTQVGGQPSNKKPTIFKNGTGKTDLLDRFIKNVDEAYKTSINKTVLADMLAEAKRDLISLKKTKRQKHVAKVLTIIYRNGVVKPTTFPSARKHKYHWELKTKYQPWEQVGHHGQHVVHPDTPQGLVRLHYDHNDTHLVSNQVDIGTIIKRRGANIKRQPFTFSNNDPEFIARCKGVAGRILRLTRPRTGREPEIQANRFSMRVFQDRVSKLPEHLDMKPLDIVHLCQLDIQRARPSDRDKYIKMVEFCEPTIHLNPEGRRRALKENATGSQVELLLALPTGVAEGKEHSDDEDDQFASTDDEGEHVSPIGSARPSAPPASPPQTGGRGESKNSAPVNPAAPKKLSEMNNPELRAKAGELGLSNEQVKKLANGGNLSYNATWIAGIEAYLAKKAAAAVAQAPAARELSDAERVAAAADKEAKKIVAEKRLKAKTPAPASPAPAPASPAPASPAPAPAVATVGDDLDKLKQPALRQRAKNLGLSAGGTNDDLRKRIREHHAAPTSPAPAVASPAPAPASPAPASPAPAVASPEPTSPAPAVASPAPTSPAPAVASPAPTSPAPAVASPAPTSPAPAVASPAPTSPAPAVASPAPTSPAPAVASPAPTSPAPAVASPAPTSPAPAVASPAPTSPAPAVAAAGDDLDKLKQPALRQRAKNLGLSAGGTNDDLRKRIREHHAAPTNLAPAPAPAPAPVASPAPVAEVRDDLDNMSLADLKGLARRMKLGRHGFTRPKDIENLRNLIREKRKETSGGESKVESKTQAPASPSAPAAAPASPLQTSDGGESKTQAPAAKKFNKGKYTDEQIQAAVNKATEGKGGINVKDIKKLLIENSGDKTAINKLTGPEVRIRLGELAGITPEEQSYSETDSDAEHFAQINSSSLLAPPGDLTNMLANMTDDWASSEDELQVPEEESTLEFAESSASEMKTSSGLEFAESSAVETDSANELSDGFEFAESSDVKTSSGLEFAESSAVETDSAREGSSDLTYAESSDYD